MDENKNAPKHERKTLWQFIKFLLVSGIAGILQIILVNLLCWALADWKAPLPGFLTGIFSASVVGAGNDNWGYVFPFFASNLLANIYGYIQNKKTTFKSDAPAWCFAVYLALMVCLILFSTWLQGVIANALRSTGAELWSALAPTIAAAAAGTFQMAVLFPVEKFIVGLNQFSRTELLIGKEGIENKRACCISYSTPNTFIRNSFKIPAARDPSHRGSAQALS